MSSTYVPLAHVVIAVLSSSTASASESHAPVSAQRGRSLYSQNCARCHGFNLVGSGAVAPDLRLFPHDDKERFAATVRDGKGAMPAWKELSPEDIEALWSYVSTAASSSP